IVFDNLENIDKLNEEYMMLNWNAPQNNSLNSQTFASTKIYFESNSYKNTNQVVSKFTKDITKIFDKESDYVSTSTVFEKFKTIYGVANIVSILFIVVGIVLICSSLINLYDTIYHSVNQQKYYLTMLRAIGAKRCVIPKLYCAESVIIASWANLFIIIFGTTFSIIVKVIVDLMLKIKNVYYNLSISWFSVFAGTIIAVIILYAVTLLFSFVCTKKLSNKKITEILNEK
ncbi:MAG: ABC transporter permease, partial [Clostridia bacterium]